MKLGIFGMFLASPKYDGIYDLINANSINSFCAQTRVSSVVISMSTTKKLMSLNFSFLIPCNWYVYY